jgi:demethylmenaquinone methyltransferase/2-methoxy-6-polyprenyl-1,4-benzoquinol methylase
MIKTMQDKKNKVKNIFDSIAGKYDFLNHLLSFGVDNYWRKKALKLTKIGSESILLDVACGTGDFAIVAYRQGVRKIVGADFSHNMLELFKKKQSWIDGKVVQTTAEQMSFRDASFTHIAVAFGVRNFYDAKEGFRSFYRVLKDKGKATVLEFQMPENKIFRSLYKFYFKKILPLIGGIISKNKTAYQYLPESVEEFDEKILLVDLFKEVGFKTVTKYKLTFGIVQVVIAEK